MTRKYSLLFTLFLGLFLGGCGASKRTAGESSSNGSTVRSEAPVRLSSFKANDIDRLAGRGDRPVLVFFHTDWCKYCQNMKQTTFRDRDLIEYLNKSYYFVSFNAEQKEPVVFGGNTFTYRPRGTGTGTHEFAEIMATTDGELGYPALVVLNSNLEVVFKYNSFLSARELIPILQDVEQNLL